MYLFINQNEVQEYNGEILKYSINNRLIRTISNPTNEQLSEFGYMDLIEDAQPDYNAETQYLSFTYQVIDGAIYKVYAVNEIPAEQEEIGQVEEV